MISLYQLIVTIGFPWIPRARPRAPCWLGATWSLAMQPLPLAHLRLTDRQRRGATRWRQRMLLNIPRKISYPIISIHLIVCSMVNDSDSLLGGPAGCRSALRVQTNMIHTLVWCRISKDETLVVKHRTRMRNFTQLANLLKPIQTSEEEISRCISLDC